VFLERRRPQDWRGGVGQVAEHGAARHDDVPALARIVIVNVGNAESGLRRSKRKRNGITRPYVMLVCEGLADDDSVRIAQLGKYLLDKTAREKIRAAGLAKRLRINGRQSDGHAVIADLIGPETGDGLDTWKRLDFLSQVERDRGVAVCRRAAGGAQIEIGGQSIVHPEHDCFTETTDHDADRSHHGDGCRERTDEDGSSAQ